MSPTSTSRDLARSPARPLYLVVDVSFSTTDGFGATTGIDYMSAFVDAMLDRLSLTGIGRNVWLSVIDFADEARLPVPLSPADRLLVHRPPLEARGGTSYARAFELTAERIAFDVAQLRADGAEVTPPLVVFLTDGDPVEPDRDWQHAFAALVALDCGVEPHVWPVGYAAANPMLLARLVSPPGWAAPHVLGSSDGLAQLADQVLDMLALVEAGDPDSSIEGCERFVPPDPDDLDWGALSPAPSAADQSAPPTAKDPTP